jgi:hypothetical protein
MCMAVKYDLLSEERTKMIWSMHFQINACNNEGKNIQLIKNNFRVNK